jgi:glutamyl-tRNA synthetase
LTIEIREAFVRLIRELSELEVFDEKSLEPVFRKIAADLGIKLGKLAQPVRIALTGAAISPGLFEIIDVLGKKTVLKRLGKGLEFIDRQQDRQ